MAQWDKLKTRGNVTDRRSTPAQVGGIGLAGIVIVLAVAYFGGGEQAQQVAQVIEEVREFQNANTQQSESGEFAGEDEYEVFASAVLGSNNEYWEGVFGAQGDIYGEPTLVLFRQGTPSACGGATRATGPHYCPLDETIYLDETFFAELTSRFGARGGDVAESYVIAHEVGHHVQHKLGIMSAMRDASARDADAANALSIKLELQADCFAGLWAHSIRDQGVFEPGEIEEAIDAAEAVGDDNIQESVNGRVSPENWTHGSSAQRKAWFNRGYETGDFAQCDTFSG